MQEIFSQPPVLLKMSGEASILILLVLAVQWLCGQRLKPRWRCVLWLLVLLRLALPWTISSPVSLFNVFKMPATAPTAQLVAGSVQTADVPISQVIGFSTTVSKMHVDWLAWLWGAGAFFLAGCAAVNQYRFHRRVARLRPLTDGVTLDLFEDCKALMGVRTPVMLVETDAVKSPALFGFVRPRLLLPRGLVSTFTREELRYVFLHELAHIKRFDILIGWVALALQVVHWFNPLVWLAFYRLRVDRELACDALALSHARTGENESYGLTVVKLLEGFGQVVQGPGLAGILEDKQQMKERISMIAKFHKKDRGLALAVTLLAVLTLITMTDCSKRDTSPSARSSQPDGSQGGVPPQIVSMSPANGATNIDPDSVTEIRVTFDRPMTDNSWSMTGSGIYFPDIAGKLHYDASRTTWIAPVKLKPGWRYEFGLNSKSYRNFKSAEGVSLEPNWVIFQTTGQSPTPADLPPKVVSITPQNGATGVDPNLTEIKVVFDQPMEDGSWSMCTSDSDTNFPDGPGGARYDDTRTIWTVPTSKLRRGTKYEFWLNWGNYRNFRSAKGISLDPVDVTFTTAL